MPRVFVLGLDCLEPTLLFDRFLPSLPNFRRVMEHGVFGPLRSSTPAITIPAWLVMMTGRTPGELGLYGFKHRSGHAYDQGWIADATRITAPTVWDIAGEAQLNSVVVALPPSYPPRPLKGWQVGCFLTPDTSSDYTWPPELKAELEEKIGEYIPDVRFRTDAKEDLLDEIYLMTQQRFAAIEYLMESKPWDLFIAVEIGPDRIHHAYWRYFDELHHLHRPGSPLADAVPGYYRYLDGKLGRILDRLAPDDTLLIVSDHGAKRMKGGISMNDWLIGKGWLTLKAAPKPGASLTPEMVDWGKTIAWAWGGYYARIFLNVAGREPEGIIPAADYELWRERIAAAVTAIPGPDGSALATQVVRPEEIYTVCHGDPPDLMAFLDDLSFRAIGTLGHPSVYLEENDTGPDDAVHDWNGVFLATGGGLSRSGGPLAGLAIERLAPTILTLLGLSVPAGMNNQPITEVTGS